VSECRRRSPKEKFAQVGPNRKVPPRNYCPIAMRGRLPHMPSRAAKETSNSAPKVGTELVRAHDDSEPAPGVDK
jgi:hypothetical protein